MDIQSNTQAPTQKPSGQKQQSSNSANSTTSTLNNSKQPTVLEPEKSGMKWWMWAIIAVVVISLAVAAYSFFM